MIAPYRESGIVLDIGTGDGRFVSASARANPERFYIGVDANARPLEKLSTRITRKPAKGGLPNAMFVQAAIEELPDEFDGIATEIHINFPWGSLLKGAAVGDPAMLLKLHRVLIPGGKLTILLGIDPIRDRAEIERLRMPLLDEDSLLSVIPDYEAAGLQCEYFGEQPVAEWSRIETSWARRLGGSTTRRVFKLTFVNQQ